MADGRVLCDRCGEREARFRIHWVHRPSGQERHGLRCGPCSKQTREAIDRAGTEAVWSYERLPRLRVVA